MTYQDFLRKAAGIHWEEIRYQESDGFEAVYSAPSETFVKNWLESYLGPPLKPAGQAPGTEIEQMANPYGGIRSNQTFYFHPESKTLFTIAMLWPWTDGAHITVKIFQGRKELQAGKPGFLGLLAGLFKKNR